MISLVASCSTRFGDRLTAEGAESLSWNIIAHIASNRFHAGACSSDVELLPVKCKDHGPNESYCPPRVQMVAIWTVSFSRYLWLSTFTTFPFGAVLQFTT